MGMSFSVILPEDKRYYIYHAETRAFSAPYRDIQEAKNQLSTMGRDAQAQAVILFVNRFSGNLHFEPVLPEDASTVQG